MTRQRCDRKATRGHVPLCFVAYRHNIAVCLTDAIRHQGIRTGRRNSAKLVKVGFLPQVSKGYVVLCHQTERCRALLDVDDDDGDDGTTMKI